MGQLQRRHFPGEGSARGFTVWHCSASLVIQKGPIGQICLSIHDNRVRFV